MTASAGRGGGLSILIVTYNTRRLTVQCLASVERHCPDAEVILVDNASTDATAEWVRALFPGVRLIESDANLGFGGANNLAYAAATRPTVVMLNSDTVLNDDSLQRAAAALNADDSLGAVHPRLVGVDGRPQQPRHASPTIGQKLRQTFRMAPADLSPEDGWLAGTCLIAKREAVDAAGGLFDPALYFYWEDCDLSSRLRAAGYGLRVVDGTLVTHYGGASGGGPDAARRPDLAAWYLFGKHRWFAKHAPRWQFALLWLLDAVDVVRMTLRGLVRPSRRHEIVQARHFVRVLCARLFGGSLPKFPGRESTVRPADGAERRRVTAVVIGRNEGDRLLACLESLAGEVDRVVYVDSGSSDGSPEAAAALNATVVDLDTSIPFTAARARNAGLERVRTEFAFFLDGDCTLEPGFVAGAIRLADRRPDAAVVCGLRRERRPAASLYNRLCDAEWTRPPGDVDACGGDALMRTAAVRAAGGYPDDMIAGEEPELCERLRRRGHAVVRTSDRMTVHDAAMTRFGQWWRRAVRAGHAYAEMEHRHPGTRRRTLLSNFGYAAVLPGLAIAAALAGRPVAAAVALLPLLLLAFRLVVRRAKEQPIGDAVRFAVFDLLAKAANTSGSLRFDRNRLLGRRCGLIEYKRAAATGLGYLTSEYPRPSHTFIRREIVALEAAGWRVHRFSVRGLGGCRLVDGGDLAEDAATFKLLDYKPAVLAATLAAAATRPLRFAAAMREAVSLWRGSQRPLLKHLAYLAEACVLRRECGRRGVGHLHVHFGKNAADVALLCETLGGPTFSLTVHGPGEFDAPAPYALGRKVVRSRFTAAISEFGTGQLRRWVPVESWDRLTVVRCTVGDDFFDRLSAVTCESPDFVCVGRLTPQKGQLLLLEAVRRLRGEGVRVNVTFVGDGELRTTIERLTAEYGLADRVRVTGFVGEAEVRRLLHDARALVLPSFAEGLPVAIMESLAVGRPVVTTTIAGIPELVGHRECGWLCTSGSVASLAAALREAADAPVETLTAMGRAGHARVRRMHHTATEAARLSELLTDHTAARPSGGDSWSAGRTGSELPDDAHVTPGVTGTRGLQGRRECPDATERRRTAAPGVDDQRVAPEPVPN